MQRIDRQADLGLFAGADAVADRAAQPVDAAEGRRHAKEVALGHAGRVVPEEEADARLEAEVEERGGHEARAALLEREEVDEERGPVLSLGRGEQPAEGLTDQVLEDEVDREEEDPREPEHDLARGGPGLVAAVVVGQLAPRDGGLLGLGLRVGLVRVAGHSVTVDATDEQARAVGTRVDTGDTHTAVFTLADAAAAGLANKRNWKQYPTAMLTWRAVSQLCRVLFPDVVLGAGYVPEELGAEVTQGGEVAEIQAVEPFEVLEVGSLAISPSDAKNELLGACGDDVDLAKGLWGDRGSEEIDRAALDVLVKEGELQHRDAVAEQVAFEERPFVDTEATHQP